MTEFFISLWQFLQSTWIIWAILFGACLFPILVERLFNWLGEWKDKKYLEKHKKLEDWKKLDGREFEKVVATIYRNLGFKTKITGKSGDRGIDVVVTKEGKKYFIQCKKMDIVPPKFIREFYGSIVDKLQDGEKGIFVTTGEFTQEGREFAKDKPIELIEGLKLEKLTSQF